jgi:hypothetical protein
MAKLFAREASMRHPTKAVQIQGGYGYIKGANMERLMRGARIAAIYGGTAEAQGWCNQGCLSSLRSSRLLREGDRRRDIEGCRQSCRRTLTLNVVHFSGAGHGLQLKSDDSSDMRKVLRK